MNILVVFRNDIASGQSVPSYPWSYVRELWALGHTVTVCGEGHALPTPWEHRGPVDLLLEIENGRNEKGELRFLHQQEPRTVKSALLLIDSHGHPDLHQVVSASYDHVFFAVWDKRDLFAKHRSAHWCPNATDLAYFGAHLFEHVKPEYDFGFFGSKKGLTRADEMVAICKRNGWTYDVRQIASNRNPARWPATGEAMARCRVLFNRGQKHDGPNQRVMESMAVGRPLLTDWDPRDGMSNLFEAWKHFVPYGSLSDAMHGMMNAGTASMADNARAEVESKHLVKHRVQQILEVCA